MRAGLGSGDRRGASFGEEARLRSGLTLPLEGPWTGNFPARVIVLADDTPWSFRLARWKQKMPGTLAQYREECRHGSMHLSVVRGLRGLRWVIDHEDQFNPDAKGVLMPLRHFFFDYEPGRIVFPAATALAGMVGTKALLAVL